MIKYFPIVVLTVAGCGKTQESIPVDATGDLAYINIADQAALNNNLASYFENISYAALETNENSLLAEPEKAFYVKDRFYIVDKDAVKVFDGDGKYLFDVGTLGKGRVNFSM